VAFDKAKYAKKFASGEAKDHIIGLSQSILDLEKDPSHPDTLKQIFRIAHTLKGSSKMFGLTEMSELAHLLEDALEAFSEKRVSPSKSVFNLFLQSVDFLTDLSEVASKGEVFQGNLEPLLKRLEDVAKGKLPEDGPIVEIPVVESQAEVSHVTVENDEQPEPPPVIQITEKIEESPEVSSPEEVTEVAKKLGETSSSRLQENETIRIPAKKLDVAIKLMGEVLSNQGQMRQDLELLEELETPNRKQKEVISKLQSLSNGIDPQFKADILTILREYRSKTRSFMEKARDNLSVQGLLTDDLRDYVLKMRMLPISTVFDSLPRLVRDISHSLNKEIELTLKGGETELDNKIIEQIGPSLVHLIRNSLDHGIESPEERVRTGKSVKGTITIEARYEGGNVVVEIEDDGRGIQVEKIKEKALKQKIMDKETLLSISRSEIVDLIFTPNFSTSSFITDVSGRGVGMDVVKENIVERFNGSIAIETSEGKGTRFIIKLPLTLAIVRALVFSGFSGLKLAVPVSSIDEIIRLPQDQILEVVNKRAVRLREQLIPIYYLENFIGLPEAEASASSEPVVLILSMGNDKLGLMVESIITEEDLETKTLPVHLRDVDFIAGAAAIGRDDIISLIHVPTLFELRKEIKYGKSRSKDDDELKKDLHILVVDDSPSTREIEKSILESYGYRVDVASDGMEGLEKAKNFQYNLIVTDIEMPKLDGFSLTEALRKEEKHFFTPIIIVSSRDREEDKKKGMQVGADAYIIKGDFEQSNLLSTIKSLIR
jgi:two-component system, chemotaxis family, sensor kinase CheA